MSKSNKSVASAVAVAVPSSKAALAAEILESVSSVAKRAIDVQISTANDIDAFRADFRALCQLAGVPVIKKDGVDVFDRESEIGKKLTDALRAAATEEAKQRAHYSIGVHCVVGEDKYLPTRIWSILLQKWIPVEPALPVNHTFTAAFALGVDLKGLASVVEKPNGVKAWMRGTVAGCRPDGKGQGLRDWIKNDIDQSITRGWKTPALRRASGNKQDLADLLNGLYKAGDKKRQKHEKDGDTVVSDDQWKVLCAFAVEAAFNPDGIDWDSLKLS